MKSPYDVILRPIITEQSMEAIADKKYVFEVARDSNKVEIRKAIEEHLQASRSLSVNTLNVEGKDKRMGVTSRAIRAARKKAVVTPDRGLQAHRVL